MAEQRKNSVNPVPKELQPHVFKKGQSGNPNGRPKGSISLKEYAKMMLRQMDDEQRQEYMEGLPKQFIWEMAEGKAISNLDHTTKGKALPTPLFGNVPTDNSTTEDTEPDQAD